MNQRMYLSCVVLVVVAVVCLLAPEAAACPNCKEALAAQGSEGARLAEGYSYSILLMLAVPFGLLSTGIVLVVRAAKRGLLPPL